MEANGENTIREVSESPVEDERECCGNCPCFYPQAPQKFQVKTMNGKDLVIEGWQGECRFNPPIPLVLLKPQAPSVAQPNGGAMAQVIEPRYVPQISINWCFQHPGIEKVQKEESEN